MAGSDNQQASGLDVAKAFTPFTAEELDQLRKFSEHVSDMEQRSLAKKKELTVQVFGDDSGLKDVDEEAVHALISAYRKIALLKNDPGYFNKIHKLLGRHANAAGTTEAEKAKIWLKTLKEFRKQFLDVGLIGYQLKHGDGSTETISPGDIIKLLVNGVVSHSESGPRERWERLGGWKNGVLLMNALTAIADELRVFRSVDKVVQEILATPELRAEG